MGYSRKRSKFPAKYNKVKLRATRVSEKSEGQQPFVSPEFPISCRHCVRKWSSIAKLNSHVLTRHSPKYKKRAYTDLKPRCELCGRESLSLGLLAQHLKFSHAVESERFRCSEVSVERKFYDYFNRYRCQICGDTFVLEIKFDSHMDKGHTFNRRHRNMFYHHNNKGVNYVFHKEKVRTASILSDTSKRFPQLSPWTVLPKKSVLQGDKVEKFETLFPQ